MADKGLEDVPEGECNPSVALSRAPQCASASDCDNDPT